MNNDNPVPLLSVEHLTKRYPAQRTGWFRRSDGTICTVYDVSLTVGRGEIVGIVGESGSGKTTVARMISRLIEASDGVVELDGTNVLQMSFERVRTDLRRSMRVIFQDPDAVLNPGYPIGEGLRRAIRLHSTEQAHDIEARVVEVLAQVGMDASYTEKYPDQLSGGEKRRLGVARALCTGPSLIIADEPLSGLDVMLQEQVLSLLIAEQQRQRFGMILVSHDLDRVHQVCDRVAVMFGGRIVELLALRSGNTDLGEQYKHPYSLSLQQARRRLERSTAGDGAEVPAQTAGNSTGNSGADRAACVFAGRCEREVANGMPGVCRSSSPPLQRVGAGHEVACHFADGA